MVMRETEKSLILNGAGHGQEEEDSSDEDIDVYEESFMIINNLTSIYENTLSFTWSITNFAKVLHKAKQQLHHLYLDRKKPKLDEEANPCYYRLQSDVYSFPYPTTFANDTKAFIKWRLLFFPAGNPNEVVVSSTRLSNTSVEASSAKPRSRKRRLSDVSHLSSTPNFENNSSAEEEDLAGELSSSSSASAATQLLSSVSYGAVYISIENAEELPKDFSVNVKFAFRIGDIRSKSVDTFSAGKLDWGFANLVRFDPANDVDTLSIVTTLKQKHAVPNRNTYESRFWIDKVGLKNLGATCYLNSLLQTLFYIKSLRDAVYSAHTEYYGKEVGENNILENMQRLFFELETSEEAVDTKKLTKSFGWTTFELFMQHDVQELNRQLCDKLELAIKDKENNIILQLFVGEYKSFVRCVDVDYESAKVETYYDLQLDVKHCSGVYESFDKFVAVERLEGENQYYANEEFKKQDAEKGISFVSFPSVLNLHLKRFQYNFHNDSTEKINDRFSFPFFLNLSKYKKEDGNEELFVLQSVLVHSGNVNAGHYFAYINTFDKFEQNSELDTSEEGLRKLSTWYKFDDELVLRVNETRVVEGCFGGETTRKVEKVSNAYMLVYFKVAQLSNLLKHVDVKREVRFAVLKQGIEREIAFDESVRRKKNELREQLEVKLVSKADLVRFDESSRYCAETAYFSSLTQSVQQSQSIDFLDFLDLNRTVLTLKRSNSVAQLYDLASKALSEDEATSRFTLWSVCRTNTGVFRVTEKLQREDRQNVSKLWDVESFRVAREQNNTLDQLCHQLILYVQVENQLEDNDDNEDDDDEERVLLFVKEFTAAGVVTNVREVFLKCTATMREIRGSECCYFLLNSAVDLVPLHPEKDLKSLHISTGDIIIYHEKSVETGLKEWLFDRVYKMTFAFSLLDDNAVKVEVCLDIRANLLILLRSLVAQLQRTCPQLALTTSSTVLLYQEDRSLLRCSHMKSVFSTPGVLGDFSFYTKRQPLFFAIAPVPVDSQTGTPLKVCVDYSVVENGKVVRTKERVVLEKSDTVETFVEKAVVKEGMVAKVLRYKPSEWWRVVKSSESVTVLNTYFTTETVNVSLHLFPEAQVNRENEWSVVHVGYLQKDTKWVTVSEAQPLLLPSLSLLQTYYDTNDLYVVQAKITTQREHDGAVHFGTYSTLTQTNGEPGTFVVVLSEPTSATTTTTSTSTLTLRPGS